MDPESSSSTVSSGGRTNHGMNGGGSSASVKNGGSSGGHPPHGGALPPDGMYHLSASDPASVAMAMENGNNLASALSDKVRTAAGPHGTECFVGCDAESDDESGFLHSASGTSLMKTRTVAMQQNGVAGTRSTATISASPQGLQSHHHHLPGRMPPSTCV